MTLTIILHPNFLMFGIIYLAVSAWNEFQSCYFPAQNYALLSRGDVYSGLNYFDCDARTNTSILMLTLDERNSIACIVRVGIHPNATLLLIME